MLCSSSIESPLFAASIHYQVTDLRACIWIQIYIFIEPFYDKARSSEFTSLVRELDTPGVMTVSKTYSFKFSDVEKPYESYNGLNIRLRYFVRVTITRQYSPNVEKEQDFWIQNINTITDTDQNPSIKMEVGIEDCLHIEFIFNKTKYFLQDAIIGKVYFMLVRIRIKKMEIAIIKREAIGEEGAPAMKTESETVAKYEIMDGCPVRGEAIPVRMFLENFSLSPTYRNVNNQVRYIIICDYLMFTCMDVKFQTCFIFNCKSYSSLLNISSTLCCLMKKEEGISSNKKSSCGEELILLQHQVLMA